MHTDIKADNIIFGAADDTVFREFEMRELENPSPRKVIDEKRLIYTSRELNIPKDYDPPVLCDFGSVVCREKTDTQSVVQPALYRAPEVILGVPWNYKIDIWNVGCMVRMTPLLLLKWFTNILSRSGTYLRTKTCSLAKTRSVNLTVIELISLA